MDFIKDLGNEVVQMFEILNTLSHDRRRVLFGFSKEFNEWLKNQGISNSVSDLIRKLSKKG